MRFPLLFSAFLASALVSCVVTAPVPNADSDNIREHVEYLASDALAGRETGSAGYLAAADYVAGEFQRMGLQPAGTQGYLQPVPLVLANWGEREPTLVLQGRDGDITFKFGEDFVASPPTYSEATEVAAGLVFVGFGIEAPEYGVDDYKGLDVRGKIAVILSGRPQKMPNEVGAHYASTRTKRETAARHGAVGYIMLNTPQRERRWPFKRSLEHLRDDSLDWINAEGAPGNAVPGLHPGVLLDIAAARQLFFGAKRSLEAVFTEMENGLVPQGFSLPYRAKLSSGANHKRITSPNVVALLPGSDPRLKNEYVVLSAHLDHIGMGENGAVHNGAQDNAAGIAVMLETARLFVTSGRPPRRSILFIAVTGEEKGLLGSDYFARHPTVPQGSIIANINLDMPMLLYPFKDIIAFGAEHSNLGKIAERAAEKSDLKLSPDPMPEQVIFVRSDHYNFVRQGVPSIYLISGREARDSEIDGVALQTGFLKERYHRPTDVADEQVNYIAAKQFTEVNYAIAREVVDADEKPHWYRDDFFGELFGRRKSNAD